MFKKKLLLPIILAIVVIIAPYLIALRGQTSDEKAIPKLESKTPQNATDIRKTFPVVEYSNEAITDTFRKAKSEKYNKIKVLNTEITQNEQEASFLD